MNFISRDIAFIKENQEIMPSKRVDKLGFFILLYSLLMLDHLGRH